VESRSAFAGIIYGFVSHLVGSPEKAPAVPLQGELQEGIEQMRPGVSFAGKPATLVTRMANLAVEKAKQVGCLSYVALDAYYSAGPLFTILKNAVNEKGQRGFTDRRGQR
jgi:hypothetical protein